jgi:holo-[acyl-carrier protein] synthase
VIAGIGIDLVRIDRVWGMLQRKGDRALARLFTERERARCVASKHPPESYAARWAAKEAVFKALGTGWGRGGSWTDVEVVSGPGGAPTVALHGAAARAAEARGVRRVHLSLTHSDDTAAAFVVLEG